MARRADVHGVPTCLPRSQTSKSACAGHCGLCGVESAGCLGVSVLRAAKLLGTSGDGVANDI
jgi:hypothetical protein